MASSSTKKNSGLANPRRRMYIEWWKNSSIDRTISWTWWRKGWEWWTRVHQAWSKMLGSHVLPRWQTGQQTPRLASVQRAPLQQFKQCMGIAVLQTGLVPTRCVLPASVVCFTSFGGDYSEPSALPCSGDDALVGKDAVAPKSCLSPFEMRTTSAAGDLLPTGKTSTATKITFDHSPI